MNKSQVKKLIIAAVFLLIVLGSGFLISRKINKKSIKKTGYKTDYNPNYIDSSVRSKNK